MFKVLLEHASFNESLSANKQYKFSLLILCQLPKLIHSDAKVPCSFGSTGSAAD